MKSRAGRKKSTVPFTAYLEEDSRLQELINGINRDLNNLPDVFSKDTHGGHIKVSGNALNNKMQSLKRLMQSRVSYLQRKQREALANIKKV